MQFNKCKCIYMLAVHDIVDEQVGRQARYSTHLWNILRFILIDIIYKC